MFRKKRRMEFIRPGERKRREEREVTNDRRISRRVFMMRGAVGLGFTALTGKLWSMQIAEGGEFREIAAENIVRFERLKAPRGRITDRAGQPLAENRRAWSVKVIGSRLPAESAERQRVLDTLAEQLQLNQVLVLDRALVPVGSEAAIVNALSKRIEVDSATLIARMMRPDASLELLRDDLPATEAAALQARLADIPGVRILNSLDYALETHFADDVPMLVKKDVDRETALAIAANAVYLPGVIVDDTVLVRQYSGGPEFSHILGYTGPIDGGEYYAETTATGTPIYDQDDHVGRGGVEQALERELRGEKGGRWIQVDSNGIERLELTDQRRDPVNGLSARLTIHRDFQKVVTEAVKDGIKFAADEARKIDREPPGSGVAIVMNPQNGEILAMVSWPTFDNQLFVDGISQAAYDSYVNDPFDPLLNRAISGTYSPGSTLKPLLAAAGLQEGVMTPDDKFTCKGNIRVPHTWDETQGNTYPCWEYEVGHGEVDLYKGIAQSCDVYFYNVGAPDQKAENDVRVHFYIPGDENPHYFRGLGIERIKKYLDGAYGFGRASGIELAGEADGLVPDPKWLLQNLDENWSVGDTINVSIGQGHLLCTPLQLLNGTAALANGGRLYQPRLIKELVRDDGTIVKKYPTQLIRNLTQERDGKVAIKPEHLDTVREGMRRTVTEGTGLGKITISDVVVGAKSGTAEFGEAVDGKYKLGHAWFSAFAPFENPEICVVTLVVGGYEGSVYAGPITNRILDAYFHQPGVREAAQQ